MADAANTAKKGADPKILAFAAVVIVAALAAIGFYGGFFGGAAPPAQPNPALPLATPEARLLLASFDSGAALSDYFLNYTVNDNGVKSEYTLVKNGSDSFVGVRGSFGKMYGFFGKDNLSDTICLEYGGEAECAVGGNNSDMADIAAGLKILRPNPRAYLSQKDDTRKHIATGAIRLDSGMVEEKVGNFDTQKISYTLDYSNLTVQQMISLGKSPNDESLLSITDQRVTFWIDRQTGLMVKSHASYSNRGTPGFYDTEYSGAAPASRPFPEKQARMATALAFIDFYSKSTKDYADRAACFAKSGAEQDTCLKSIAADRGDWETCKLIKTPNEFESCSIIVAQGTLNSTICGTLPMLADDCYIAVAGENGDFGLCKSVKNASLSSNCIAAATAGQKKVEAASALAAKAYAARNCVEDKDCKTFGNANQYCAPRNSTASFANSTHPAYSCLSGVPCGCLEGYCGFAKNETYYSCINGVEDQAFQEYLKSLIPGNSTANDTINKTVIN
ncbi:MAG: hypothetical protein WC861_03940 [Candidatus Micrarchaeia archaeon]|jgi:hypothetical protein